MSKNFKLFLGFTYLVILAVFLYFIFTNVQINRLNDFLYYKELQLGLDNVISRNLLINIIYFFIFVFFWIVLLGFGSPILIFSGIIFGKWIGTVISIVSISIGALALYSIANFFFRDIVKKILKKNLKNTLNYLKKMNLNIFFYIDLLAD